MRKIMQDRRITRVLTMTAGLLAAGVVAGAPQAAADPGDIGDASLWRTSPVCTVPGEEIKLSAEGIGVLEFEYRVIGGEPTTHRARPPAQSSYGYVTTYIPERQIRWRVVAYETDLTEASLLSADISWIEARCGNDIDQELEEGRANS